MHVFVGSGDFAFLEPRIPAFWRFTEFSCPTKGIQHPQRTTLELKWPWSYSNLCSNSSSVPSVVGVTSSDLSQCFVPDFLHLKMVLYYLLQKATMHWMTPMLVRGGYLMHGAQYKMKIQGCLFKLHGAFQDGNSRALNQAQVLPSLGPVQLHGSHPWSWPWHSGSCHLT